MKQIFNEKRDRGVYIKMRPTIHEKLAADLQKSGFSGIADYVEYCYSRAMGLKDVRPDESLYPAPEKPKIYAVPTIPKLQKSKGLKQKILEKRKQKELYGDDLF